MSIFMRSRRREAPNYESANIKLSVIANSVSSSAFIMKMQTNVYPAKLPSLEEGQMSYGTLSEGSTSNHDRSSDVYARCIRFIKVILYIELILLLGWAGCIFLTKHYQDHKYNSIHGAYDGPDRVRYPVREDAQKADDFKDSLALPLWLNTFSASDYKDEPTDAEKPTLLDDAYANLRFDIEFPDLAERYHPRQLRTITEQDSSSSSSEETKASPKKRSAESSSSESDSSDSSSEKDQATADVTKEKDDCPSILDKDGNTIEDPADIVSHIKKNWLKSLLETPVPDCDEPKPAKTVTVDDCGRFVIKCGVDESDEDNDDNDDGKESRTKNRNTRDAEVNHAEEENCNRVFNASIEILNKNAKNIASDKLPSSPVEYDIRLFLQALTYRSAAEQSISGHSKTLAEWRHTVKGVIQNVTDVTDPEERHYLEKYKNSTENIVREISESIKPLLDIYNCCNRVRATPRDAQIITFLINSYRCVINAEVAKEREDALAAEIVPGEPTDPLIVELRESFKRGVKSWIDTTFKKAAHHSANHSAEATPASPVNVNDQQWESHLYDIMLDVSKGSSDLALRGRLERHPTQEHANALRAITEYYVLKRDRCGGIW